MMLRFFVAVGVTTYSAESARIQEHGFGHQPVQAAPSSWLPVRGSYAIYGFDGLPATPAEECVTNPNTGEAYRFGDVVPDSCCQAADMHDIAEVQFPNRETPCGQFPLQYQPASMQFPLFATAYCDAPNHVMYEEFHCHQAGPDEGCAGCQTTFSHEFNGPVCVKFNDFPGQPYRYYGWLEGCENRGAVHEGWANHFAAFGAQDVERILLDYIEESVITVFNFADNSKTVYTGLDGVRRCFVGLFATLTDTSDLAAPIQIVEENFGNDPTGQVYLVWSAAASGYPRATDTFIFNNEGKITRQDVVLHYNPGFQGSR